MIIPLTLPSASSSSTSAGTLPPALAQLGSSELFLLELQGELEVAGDKHGQVVGRLTIDDSDSGKVRLLVIVIVIPISLLSLSFSFSSGGGCGPRVGQTDAPDRSPPLRRQDRQLAKATGRVTTCAHATTIATITTPTAIAIISHYARRGGQGQGQGQGRRHAEP